MKLNDKMILSQEEAIEFCIKLLPLYNEDEMEYVDDWIQVGSTWEAHFYYDSFQDRIKFSLYKVTNGNTDTTVDYSTMDETNK